MGIEVYGPEEREKLERRLRELEIEVARLRSELARLKTPPHVVGVVEEVLDDGRVVVKSSTGPVFVVSVEPSLLPSIRAGSRVAMNSQFMSVIGVLPRTYDPFVAAAEIVERPEVTYADIGGLREQIEEVREVVELPLLRPDLFRDMGIEPPKGVLLAGPPGTGKTLLAKAVAHHTNATFIKVVGSELVRKFIGEGAQLVRDLFALARRKAPSIVFIDEIDAIGARRLDVGTSGEREVQRTLMQLLAEMDGFRPLDNVKIMAATNRLDILDPALLRPGRFDRIIKFPLPDLEARREIFQIHTRRMRLRGVDLDFLAKATEGATGADIRAICIEAGMLAIREGRNYATTEDFMRAIGKILGKKEKEDLMVL